MSGGSSQTVFQVLGQIVTWVIVIAGWLVVNRQNNDREMRREIRSRLDTLEKDIRELELVCVQFHTSEYDDKNAWQIVTTLERLWDHSSRLKLASDHALEVRIFNVRRAMTLRNFDKSDHAILSMNAEQIGEIAASVNRLINALEKGYADRYY
jgi:hypothetical protein